MLVKAETVITKESSLRGRVSRICQFGAVKGGGKTRKASLGSTVNQLGLVYWNPSSI